MTEILGYLGQLTGTVIAIFLAVRVFKKHHQPPSESEHLYAMLSWKVYKQCTEQRTVASELAQVPTKSPREVFNALYEHHHPSSNDNPDEVTTFGSKSALQRAHTCGNWGAAQPSNLFLKVLELTLGHIEERHSSASYRSITTHYAP